MSVFSGFVSVIAAFVGCIKLLHGIFADDTTSYALGLGWLIIAVLWQIVAELQRGRA